MQIRIKELPCLILGYLFLIACVLLVPFCVSCWAEEPFTKLVWDASPEPEVTHYVVSRGTDSGDYTEEHVTSDTFMMLSDFNQVPGNTYYYSVQAVAEINGHVKRSVYSNEQVIKIVAISVDPVVLRKE